MTCERQAEALAQAEQRKIQAQEEFAEKKANQYRTKEMRAESAKRRARVKELEKEIENTETLISGLEQDISDPETASDYSKMNEKCNELEQAKTRLDVLMDEWAELSDSLN